MELIDMIEEKILFWISLLGFAALNFLQVGARIIFNYGNPDGLIVIGAAMGFCAVGAATAYRLVRE